MKTILIIFFTQITLMTYAQFNTASYQSKLNSISIEHLSKDNQTVHFLTYENISPKKSKIKKVDSANVQLEIPEDFKLEEFNIADLYKPNAITPNEKNTTSKKRFEHIEIAEERAMKLSMPLDDLKITSNFGNRFHPIDKKYKMHYGVDFAAANSNVYAVLDGVVKESFYDPKAGIYLVIDHNGIYETSYLHLSEFYYKKGDTVYAGDIIAKTGNTGKSTGEHLHFSVKEGSKHIDPIRFLNSLISTHNAIIDHEN